MDQPIKLTREGLKHIIRNVLKEALDNDENNMFVIPKLPHTDNAFKVGDVIYVTVRKHGVDYGNDYKKYGYANADETYKVIGIEGDKLLLDGDKVINKQNPNLKCAASWLKAYELFTGGNGINQINSSDLMFDYQTINGIEYIVIEARSYKFSNKQKYGYEYNKIIKGEACQRVNFGVDDAKFTNNFYCLPGKPKPDKYLKGGPEGSVHIPDDWVVPFKGTKMVRGQGVKFAAWNPEYKDEILKACPWLTQMKTPWPDASGRITSIIVGGEEPSV